MADPSIGLMDGAYFVGRKEIVDWINNTLGIGIAKVEQTASGAIACQLLDMIFPGQVQMNRVNWMARVDHEFVPNYKILQTAFDRIGIERHIDVDKLIRGKYQDNLEFMQWFKRYFEMHTPAEEYDTAANRERGKGGAQYNREFGTGASRATTTASSRTGSAAGRGARAPAAGRSAGATRAAAPTRPAASAPRSTTTKTTRPTSGSKPSAHSSSAGVDAKLAAEVADLRRANEELQAAVDGLEKERNFYFDKLTDIEGLLQGKEGDAGWIDQVFEILYATTDDFVTGDEAEGVDAEGADESEPLPEADNAVEDETY